MDAQTPKVGESEEIGGNQGNQALALLREAWDKGYLKTKHTDDEDDLEERVRALFYP